MTLEKLFRDHEEFVRWRALSLTKDKVTARDLEGEFWEKIANIFPDKYTEGGTPQAWLGRILKNLWVDICRKKSKGREGGKSVYALSYDLHEVPLDHMIVLGGIHESQEQESVLNSILMKIMKERLSADQRRTLLYRMREKKLSFQEIADLENTSINTVIGRARYARNNILINLKHYCEPEMISYIVHSFPKVKRFIERRGVEYRKKVFKN